MPFYVNSLRLQLFDDNGAPLSNGFVYFYESGTSTLSSQVYEDSLGTPASNPVQLNADGTATVYLDPVAYRVYITKPSGVMVADIDPWYGVGYGTGGTASIAVVPTYAALRSLASDYLAVIVCGRASQGDGAGGLFIQAGTGADDDGTQLLRDTTLYKREYKGRIDPRWFGVQYGVSEDQIDALDAALAVGPVESTGLMYLASDHHLTGDLLVTAGGFYTSGSATPKLYMDGILSGGCAGMFGSGVIPVFGKGVCDELKFSWFNSIAQSLCSSWNYKYLIDKDCVINSSLSIPSNYGVDFSAGSRIIVASHADISIKNLVYKGNGQIIQYNDIGYIGEVDLGSAECLLEWFGGVAGTAINTDNSIAFKAALSHGTIHLISSAGTFYNVLAGTYTVPNSVSIIGDIPANNATSSINDEKPSTIRMNGSIVNVGALSIDSSKLDGFGAISASGNFTTHNSQISNTIARSTGLSKINDTITIDPQYIMVGSAGKILQSGDLSNWVLESSGTSSALNAVANSGEIYVAVGYAGIVLTSTDGSTWAHRNSGVTESLYNVKYIHGKFVAVGASGTIIYSADGKSWNVTRAGTSDLKSASYSTVAGSWIVVGALGTIYVSTDLVSWSPRTISNVTGTLYDVASNDTTTMIVGYNGKIFSSANLNLFIDDSFGEVTDVQTVAYYSDKKIWVAGTSNGSILKSTDGVNYSKIQTSIQSNEPIYSQIEINGKYLFACGSGYLLSTFDFNLFSQTQPLSSSGNNFGISGKIGKVIAIGDAGAIKETPDLHTWTSQAVLTSTNLNKAVLVNGVYYLLGASGTYLTSYDGTTWTVRSIGALITIRDMAVNADKNLWIAIGDGGKIYSSLNPIADTPVWTLQNSNATADLTRVIYDSSTWYVYGKAGTILKSSDGAAWTNINAAASGALSNGIISNGSLITVYFGNNGTIRSTVDGVTYASRVSGTTANLLSGVYASGKFVIVGVGGIVLTSTDGVSWTQQTSGTSAQLNRVVYINGKFFVVGSSATIRQSIDAVTWSTAASTFHNTVGDTISITAGFRGIGYSSGHYFAFGEVGCSICHSDDLSTWVLFTPTNSAGSTAEAITVVLNDCYVNNKSILIVGDAGTAYAMFDDGMEHAYKTYSHTTDDLKRIYSNLIVGGNGYAGLISGCDAPYASAIITPLYTGVTDNLIDAALIGSQYTAISQSTTIQSPNMVIWQSKADTLTLDIASVVVSGGTYYVLSGGKLYSSTDNIVFNWIKNTDATSFNKIDSTYYLLGEADSVIEQASTVSETGFAKNILNSDSYITSGVGKLTINGTSIIYYSATSGDVLIGSLNGLSIQSLGSAFVDDSVVDVAVENSYRGSVSGSKLVSIAVVGTCNDCSFSSFNGDIEGNIARSAIKTHSSIGIKSNVSIIDSSLTELEEDTEIFSVDSAVVEINLTNCNTTLTGMLLYSANANLNINLFGGFLSAPGALSNGYAKVYVNSVFDIDGNPIANVSVYSLQGETYQLTALGPSSELTNSLTGWHHAQLSNFAVNGNAINVATPLLVSRYVNSLYALRYRLATATTKAMFEMGGKLTLKVSLPAGYDKTLQKKIKLKVSMYVPEYEIYHQYDINNTAHSLNNGAQELGNHETAWSIKDSASLISNTYIWSGRRELSIGSANAGGSDDWNVYWDSYGDKRTSISYIDDPYAANLSLPTTIAGISDDAPNHAPYFVIYSDEDCILPVGTTIELIAAPGVSVSNNSTWTGVDVDTTVDTNNQIEFQNLSFGELKGSDLILNMHKDPSSITTDETHYMPVVTAGESYKTRTPYYFYFVSTIIHYWRYDPALIYPALAATGKNIKINIFGLKPNAYNDLIYGTSDGSGGISHAGIVTGGTTLVDTFFTYLIKGHYKHSTDNSYSVLVDTILNRIAGNING